jgi:hypothetical protein
VEISVLRLMAALTLLLSRTTTTDNRLLGVVPLVDALMELVPGRKASVILAVAEQEVDIQ